MFDLGKKKNIEGFRRDLIVTFQYCRVLGGYQTDKAKVFIVVHNKKVRDSRHKALRISKLNWTKSVEPTMMIFITDLF